MVRVIGPLEDRVREDAGEPASPVDSATTRGALLARALAGDGLLRGVRGPALDLRGRAATVGSSPSTDCHDSQRRLARVRQVVGEDRRQQDGVRLLAVGRSGPSRR